jgi:hypothetical protein
MLQASIYVHQFNLQCSPYEIKPGCGIKILVRRAPSRIQKTSTIWLSLCGPSACNVRPASEMYRRLSRCFPHCAQYQPSNTATWGLHQRTATYSIAKYLCSQRKIFLSRQWRACTPKRQNREYKSVLDGLEVVYHHRSLPLLTRIRRCRSRLQERCYEICPV